MALNEIYSLHQVLVMMVNFGGIVKNELLEMTTDGIEDKGSALRTKVSKTKHLTNLLLLTRTILNHFIIH